MALQFVTPFFAFDSTVSISTVDRAGCFLINNVSD